MMHPHVRGSLAAGPRTPQLWRGVMRALQLLKDVASDQQALDTLSEVLEPAWNEIADRYVGCPVAMEAARMKLAQIILSVAMQGTRDPAQMRAAATRLFVPTTYVVGGELHNANAWELVA